jgi:hypothetical protein
VKINLKIIIFIAFCACLLSINAQTNVLCKKQFALNATLRFDNNYFERMIPGNANALPKLKIEWIFKNLLTSQNIQRLKTPGLVKGDSNARVVFYARKNHLEYFSDTFYYCDSTMVKFKYFATDTCHFVDGIVLSHAFSYGCIPMSDGGICYILPIIENYYEGALVEVSAVVVNQAGLISQVYTLANSCCFFGGNQYLIYGQIEGSKITRWIAGENYSNEDLRHILYKETISMVTHKITRDSFLSGGYFLDTNSNESILIKNDFGSDSVIYFSHKQPLGIKLKIVVHSKNEYECQFPGSPAKYKLRVDVTAKTKTLFCFNPDGTKQTFYRNTDLGIFDLKPGAYNFMYSLY